ncbi:uncharacterized protein I206_101481 [Kwoniella pini CBS 10737]|uniref:N-acetyltransferase domain-containing protein n=1 Tax=Kwoniella pini CBS 10737 TaxID=1296096 RepID=A0A1B9HWJ6_9TREE|nr:uncharacterized protein I206_06546 [Kwoniella pini CBS 10737]OCF47643.1 hypothetical protein I206_06546 [Kwoniella pini CBS 10737]
MSYTIRPGVSSDSKALSILLKESFYQAFRNVEGVTEEFFNNYFKTTLNPNNLKKVLENDKWTFLVAELENEPEKLQGMIQILHPNNDDNDEISFKKNLNKQVHLSRFYLLPSSQGSGLALILFEEILKICKNLKYTTMELDVLSTNYRGIRFYEKMGFKKIKEVHNEGDDKFKRVDWIMIKDLI